MNWAQFLEDGIKILNAVGFVGFVGLLGAATFRMAQRLVLYSWAGKRASIILRRDIALLGGFFLIFGSAAAIRFFGWGEALMDDSLLRFLYLLGANIIGIGALGYWTWAEFFVIGVEGKEDA